MLPGLLRKNKGKITGAAKISTLTISAFVLLVGAFLLSAALTVLVKKLALRFGFVAHPVVDRYHEKTVPLGGGIAVFSTIAIFIISSVLLVKFLIAGGELPFIDESVVIHAPGFLSKIPQLLIVLFCAGLLFVTGLIDDVKNLGAFLKLAVQFAAALTAAFLADIRVEFFIESRIITSLVSAFWIVLIINAFNFLDNMDGLSAGIAVIASAYLFVTAASGGQVFVSAMALLLIGSLAGFGVFNFPPAKVFMGDAGSFVVGFFVAVLTLRTTYYHQAQSGRWYVVFVPLVVMAVPLYDFISVTFLRICQGKSPFAGDTQHFSHRLKRHGLGDTQVVLTLYLATLCTGLGATFLDQVNTAGAILIFVQTFLILAIIAVFESTVKNGGTEK